MLVFPQLRTGAASQYSIRRVAVRPTFRRETGDGDSRHYAAAVGGERWEVAFDGLTADEVAEITGLHELCAGRLKTFLFLDPSDNLLTYSEDLTQSTWTKSGLLDLIGGVSDPIGGTGGSRVSNNGASTGRAVQILGIPATFAYCLSAFIRLTTGGGVRLTARAGSEFHERAVSTNGEWTRAWMQVRPGTGVSVEFAVELDPGTSVEIFGLQVNAQINPGPYLRTERKNGIVEHARFADDEITVRARGLDDYSVRLGIVRAI